VPVEVPLTAGIDVGLSVSETTLGPVIVSTAGADEPPKLAVIVAVWSEIRKLVFAVNVPLVWPDAIVIDAGMLT